MQEPTRRREGSIRSSSPSPPSNRVRPRALPPARLCGLLVRELLPPLPFLRARVHLAPFPAALRSPRRRSRRLRLRELRRPPLMSQDSVQLPVVQDHRHQLHLPGALPAPHRIDLEDFPQARRPRSPRRLRRSPRLARRLPGHRHRAASLHFQVRRSHSRRRRYRGPQRRPRSQRSVVSHHVLPRMRHQRRHSPHELRRRPFMV
jgi:hypothetical protein